MQKTKPKEILVPCITLFLICLIITACLAFVNVATKNTIAQQEKQKKDESCKVVLSSAESFEEVTGADTYYIGKDASGNIVGYSFITSSKGYGGDISVMTGIDKDKKVTGVVVLSQDETPGLGANTEKESFTEQYKSDGAVSSFEVVKTAPSEGQIQAVTGATISSKAVTTAVNEALEKYDEIANQGVE